MRYASTLINKAQIISRIRFWRKSDDVQISEPKSRKNFTSHMVTLVAKLVNMRGSDGTVEFKALCKVFYLTPGVRKKLLPAFISALRDPLPPEYHAKQISLIYQGKSSQRLEVLERLMRIAAASHSFIGRDEFLFLQAMAEALAVSHRHFIKLCGRYEIEIPQDNPYAVLGVNRLSTQREIKRKYHHLVREYHPDNVVVEGYSPSEMQAFNQKLAEINEAYRELKAAA